MSEFTKRASKACTWCHERKTRCDASTLGLPCTRCRQDDKHCKMRKKLPRFPPPQISPITSVPATTSPVEYAAAPDAAHKNYVPFSSYNFIQMEEYAKLDQHDIEFLESKGCLKVPSRPFLEEFIGQYFLHIQPCTPIIDESAFWHLFRRTDDVTSAPKLPLLLLQAIAFAGSPYISLETARNCGFQNKRDAWNTLHKRAKTLFHFYSGEDELVKAQVALLLTFHTSANEPQAASLWLTHAIHAATEATCKGHTESLEGSEDTSQRASSRLWWSILLRDRNLCLGLRRRPQISTFELRMMADLPVEDDFKDEINSSEVYDPKTKRMLFAVFKEQCSLAVLLTEITTTVFGTHGLSLPLLSEEQFYASIEMLNKTKTSLRVWKEVSIVSHLGDLDFHKSVKKFALMMLLSYHTARIDIAHYEALIIEKHRDYFWMDYTKQISHTANTLLDAADKVMELLNYFSQKGKVQELPLSIDFAKSYINRVGYMAMPLVLSAINLKLSGTIEQTDSRRMSVEALGELMSHSRRVYDVTDFISTQTDDILHLAYLTSQQVFLQDKVNVKPTDHNSHGILSPSNVTKRKMEHRRITNWHDAFLHHTRAYLLISTTVDYLMSVGRLPKDNTLPELVCFMPPLGRVKLPWSLGQRGSREADLEPPGSPRERKRRKRAENQVISNTEYKGIYKDTLSPSRHSTHSDFFKELEGEQMAHHDHFNPAIEPRIINVDFWDLGLAMGQVPMFGQSLSTSPESNPASAMEYSGAETDFQQRSRVSAHHDSYDSGLVQDFFGEAYPVYL